MLDEVWLRARRTVVHGLEKQGLWPDQVTYSDFAREQWRQGERLRRGILGEVLGSDYNLLRSEALFGASNDRLRARLPFALSFGFELGRGLARLASNGGPDWLHVAPISSAFNLGISVFDLIADDHPSLFASFSEQFDERVLHGLVVDPAMLDQADSRICALPDPELRILMRLIVWIMRRIGDPVRLNGWNRDALLVPLVRAYRAEMASRHLMDRGSQERLEIARDKSTLPFVVIGNLALASTGHNKKTANLGRLEDLVRELAGCFWLVDDLSDLVKDFRAGSVNSLLLRAGQFESETYVVASTLLRGGYVQEAADHICQHVTGVSEILLSGAFEEKTAKRLLGCCLGYVRDWIM